MAIELWHILIVHIFGIKSNRLLIKHLFQKFISQLGGIQIFFCSRLLANLFVNIVSDAFMRKLMMKCVCNDNLITPTVSLNILIIEWKSNIKNCGSKYPNYHHRRLWFFERFCCFSLLPAASLIKYIFPSRFLCDCVSQSNVESQKLYLKLLTEGVFLCVWIWKANFFLPFP